MLCSLSWHNKGSSIVILGIWRTICLCYIPFKGRHIESEEDWMQSYCMLGQKWEWLPAVFIVFSPFVYQLSWEPIHECSNFIFHPTPHGKSKPPTKTCFYYQRGYYYFFCSSYHKIHLYSIFTYVSYHCLCSLALTPLLPLSCKIQEFLINFKKSPQIECHSLVWKTCLYTQWTTLFVLGTNAYHVQFFPVPKILATLLSLFCRLCWVRWCVIWPVFFTNSYITATFFLSAPCLHLQFASNKGLESLCLLLLRGTCQGSRSKSHYLVQFSLLCCLTLFLIVLAIAWWQY